jgi:6-pyruvoyltetrahydropterin/6-carboxytetrahydropterin synthase
MYARYRVRGYAASMRTTIYVPFEFRARHWLPVRPEPHEHTYRVTFGICGEVDPTTGFVIDMGEVRAALEPRVAQFAQQELNGHPAFASSAGGSGAAVNPTCELMARYFVDAYLSSLGGGEARLRSVEVKLLEDGSGEYGHAVVETE